MASFLLQPQRNTLFVADLPKETTYDDLAVFFKDYHFQYASLNNNKPQSVWAKVCFENEVFAMKAKHELNGEILQPKSTFGRIKGKPVRICNYEGKGVSNNEKNYKQSLLVKNVDGRMSQKEFYQIFLQYGEVDSAKIEYDEVGNSKGYGYIYYNNEHSAEQAKEHLNKKEYYGKPLDIVNLIPFKSKSISNNALFVMNFPVSFDENDLKKLFMKYGEVKYASISKDEHGVSKGFGLISFDNPETNSLCIADVKANQICFPGLPALVVKFAVKKEEREKKANKLVQNYDMMKVQFSLLYATGEVNNENDLNKEIRLFIKVVMLQEYNPQDVIVDFPSKSGVVTFHNRKDFDMFLQKYQEFSAIRMPAFDCFPVVKITDEDTTPTQVMQDAQQVSRNVQQQPQPQHMMFGNVPPPTQQQQMIRQQQPQQQPNQSNYYHNGNNVGMNNMHLSHAQQSNQHNNMYTQFNPQQFNQVMPPQFTSPPTPNQHAFPGANNTFNMQQPQQQQQHMYNIPQQVPPPHQQQQQHLPNMNNAPSKMKLFPNMVLLNDSDNMNPHQLQDPLLYNNNNINTQPHQMQFQQRLPPPQQRSQNRFINNNNNQKFRNNNNNINSNNSNIAFMNLNHSQPQQPHMNMNNTNPNWNNHGMNEHSMDHPSNSSNLPPYLMQMKMMYELNQSNSNVQSNNNNNNALQMQMRTSQQRQFIPPPQQQQQHFIQPEQRVYEEIDQRNLQNLNPAQLQSQFNTNQPIQHLFNPEMFNHDENGEIANEIADSIYEFAYQRHPDEAGKITGMIKEKGIQKMNLLLSQPDDLIKIIDQAYELIMQSTN